MLKRRLIALALALVALLFGCAQPGAAPPPPSPVTRVTMYPKRPVQSPARTAAPSQADAIDVNSYEITAGIDDINSRLVTGAERIVYKNRSRALLPKIYFNLYVNGFSRDAAVKPYFDDQAPRVLGLPPGHNPLVAPGDDKFGYILINKVTQSSESLGYEIKDNVLEVTPVKPLEPGDTASITMSFTIMMPGVNHRDGADGSEMWCAGVFPTVAVLAEIWHTEPVYPGERTMLSDAANYNVRIKTPADVEVVGNGDGSYTINDGVRETVFSSKLVRGFPFALSAGFACQAGQTKAGIPVKLFTRGTSTEAAAALSAAIVAIDYYSDMIAPYPYTSLNIVETNLYDTTAEAFPGMIFVDSQLLGAPPLKFEIARAAATFWFGGVVGFNPIKDPWLGEGLRSYLADLVTSDSRKWTDDWKQQLARRLSKTQYIMRTDINDYASSDDFADVCVYKATMMLNALSGRIGGDAMAAALKNFYKEFSLRFAAEQDFITETKQASGQDLSDFYNTWLKQPGLPGT